MKTQILGPTVTPIAEIGIGTYLYQGSPELLRYGIELGANFIDTAEHYQNEQIVGNAIRGIRDRVFVATKVNHWRYNEILASADASLRRLGIDIIDLYQIHWPNAAYPLEDTMAAMEELVDRGKVKYIGVSNFTLPELKRAQAAMRKHRIVANQVNYSIIHRTIEPHLLPYCRAHDITIIAFSPLGHAYSSLLKADHRGVLAQLAAECGKTVAQVAINWCVNHAGVITIPKTASQEHMRQNVESSDWRLTPDQMDRLNRGVRYRSRGVVELAVRRSIRGTLQRWRAFCGE